MNIDTKSKKFPNQVKIKSFGPVGPEYEVGNPLRPLDDGDWLMQITIVRTGEKAEYRLSKIRNDPDAL